MLDNKVETFITVVKYKSYTKTAEILHMTQPAVTQHIHKLEAYYDCQLVDSSQHTIKITDAGKRLYTYLSLQQANEKHFIHILKNTVKPLCIGASLSIADYYLPQFLIKNLLTDKDRIRITVENTTNLLKKLQNGDIDCSFVEGIFDTALFETKLYKNEAFIPVVAPEHPLANKEASLQQLQDYPLILREPDSGTREILENWLSQKNVSPQSFQTVIEIGSILLIKELISQSSAVTFLYEGVVKKELSNGKLAHIKIKDYHLYHPLYFIYRKGDPKYYIYEKIFQYFVY